MPGTCRSTEAAEVERVDVGGRTITYRRAGDRPALVLLHGGWSDGRAWRPQLAGLTSLT
jgi:pimeloyl-ACP methyl ester carboxylesterase